MLTRNKPYFLLKAVFFFKLLILVVVCVSGHFALIVFHITAKKLQQQTNPVKFKISGDITPQHDVRCFRNFEGR